MGAKEQGEWRWNLVQLTERDERILEWLGVIRVSDMEALRWALGACSGSAAPVGLRKAQRWASRLEQVGLVCRARPAVRDGSLIWSKRGPIKSISDLYRQTIRHDVAVARVSSRYLAAGFDWSRDHVLRSSHAYQADGLATRHGQVELVDVALLPKPWQRNKAICDAYSQRLERHDIDSVSRFATPDVARAFEQVADRFVFRTHRASIRSLPTLDPHGRWLDSTIACGEISIQTTDQEGLAGSTKP